jgi:transcriptional regulator with XRE-family HTH domain
MEFDAYEKTIRRIQPNNYEKDTADLRKEIGRNIQKAISNRGLSQGEIAERCGITEAMLSRYIHGTSTPGIDKIYKLAAVLSCRVVDIMGEAYED